MSENYITSVVVVMFESDHLHRTMGAKYKYLVVYM